MRDAARWAELWSDYSTIAAMRSAELLTLGLEMKSERMVLRAWRHARHALAARKRCVDATLRIGRAAALLGVRPWE